MYRISMQVSSSCFFRAKNLLNYDSVGFLFSFLISYLLFRRCKNKCFESIPAEQRKEALQRLLSLGTKNEQDIFLQNIILQKPPQRKRPRKEGAGSRLVHQYHVLIGANSMNVCKEAFSSIYSISSKRLKRLNSLAKSAICPEDKRGTGRKANTTPADVFIKIDNHIDCFPTEQSHYSGRIIKYLDARLNIKMLWQTFKNKHPECKVGYKLFSNHFKEKFNLRFGQPQVDVCCECESLKTKIKIPMSVKQLEEKLKKLSNCI